jgi:hypothetical protein
VIVTYRIKRVGFSVEEKYFTASFKQHKYFCRVDAMAGSCAPSVLAPNAAGPSNPYTAGPSSTTPSGGWGTSTQFGLTGPGQGDTTTEVLKALGLGQVTKDAKAFKQRFDEKTRQINELIEQHKALGEWKECFDLGRHLKKLTQQWVDYEYLVAKGMAHEEAFNVCVLSETGEEHVANTLMGLARHPQLLTGIVAALGTAMRKNDKGKSGEDGEKSAGGKANKGTRCHKCGGVGHKQDKCPSNSNPY